MKVCMVTRAMPCHGRGGMEDHALSLAQGVAARGHDVTVVTTGHEKITVEQVGGVEIHCVPGTPSRVYSPAWRALGTAAIEKLHAERRFDVLHSQSIGAFEFLRRGLHRSASLPAAVTFHGTPYDELVSSFNLIRYAPPSRRFFNDAYKMGYWAAQYLLYYRGAAAAADALIATSDQQEDLFRRQFPVAPGRLHKVYNGMDLETFVPAEGDDALRTQFAIPAGAPVLLCIARFVRDKGLRFVVDALPAIAKAHPDVHLVLVGDGEERPALTAQVERLGVARHLHFTGYVPLNDLPRYFAISDLFVNATIRRNGYDLTMVEAMACGRVVVSSDVGSTPTLIADDVDGLLVPIGDSRALANRIIGALNDRPRLKQMGTRAREKAVSAFGLSTMVERTIEVYDAIRSTHAQP
jgi:glycosyltransferase involved in cell wall biosynthesis